MFEDIGSKLKRIAVALFWLVALCGILGGIAIMISGGLYIVIGLFAVVAGFFLAWVISSLFYGIGQLIENTDIIADKYRSRDH